LINSFRTNKYSNYIPFIIILVTFSVFSPVLGDNFINLDDDIFVYANPHLNGGLTPDFFYWAFTTDYAANWAPLTWILHMLNVQFFGMNPCGHHFVNLFLHVGSSFVLYLFLLRATAAPFKSASVAFLFALHPLHVESVAWVAEAKDVLSAFFWMITLYGYKRYTDEPSFFRYSAVLVSFALGLMSKSMVVTLPIVLLLLDWWPFNRFDDVAAGITGKIRHTCKLFVEKLPFFSLSAIVCMITYSAHVNTGDLVTEHPLVERVSRSCISYIEYIEKIIWPSKVAVFYPYIETPPARELVLVSFLILLLVSGAIIYFRKQVPFMIMGWFWFLITLLPVIGLIQVGDYEIADRYTYIPSIGLFIAIIWGISSFLERWQRRRYLVCIMSVSVLCALVTATTISLGYWKNSFTLLAHASEVTEKNWLALNNLGKAYLDSGKIDEAIWCFNEAVRAKPTYTLAMVNLAALYLSKQQYESAQPLIIRALRLDPLNEKARLLLRLLPPQRCYE